jgi:large subunit ribosomal protein L6
MSRIGKKPIQIPSAVDIKIDDGSVIVKGPKGELSRSIRPEVAITVNDGEVTLQPVSNAGLARALWGTYASHINNMITGVTEGFTKKLIVEGVGYRSEVQGQKIVLNLGYSHPITLDIPAGIEVTVEKNTISVSGSDKELVGEFAAIIRRQRKPEPYKGKGIRYDDEVIRRKEGKKSA